MMHTFCHSHNIKNVIFKYIDILYECHTHKYISTNMKINIKNRELELHYSLRILINYEEITGKSLDFADLTSISNLIKLYYSAVIASLQYAREPLDITWEDFLDFIDETGEKGLMDFGNWYANSMTANMDVEKNKKSNKDTKKTNKKTDLKLEKNV